MGGSFKTKGENLILRAIILRTETDKHDTLTE